MKNRTLNWIPFVDIADKVDAFSKDLFEFFIEYSEIRPIMIKNYIKNIRRIQPIFRMEGLDTHLIIGSQDDRKFFIDMAWH